MPIAAGLIVAGGVLATGTVAYRNLRPVNRWFPWLARNRTNGRISPVSEEAMETIDGRPIAHANRSLVLSSVSLGVTTAGFLVKPILMVISVPVGLLIFAPTFRAAWLILRNERRVNTQVLDATRITVCVVMGYYFALALDTWLRTVVNKVLIQTEDDLAHTLDQHYVEPPEFTWRFAGGVDVQTAVRELAIDDTVSVATGDLIQVNGSVLNGVAWVEEQLVTGKSRPVCKEAGDLVFADSKVIMGQVYIQVTEIPTPRITPVIRQELGNTIVKGSFFQQLGEVASRKMPPRMLALFGIMLPFWEANRAAGFLTTSFGNQMSTLGPYTLQNFVNLAAQQHLLILDGRALEKLNLVNTIVIDVRVLNDPDLRANASAAIRALRNRRWPMQELILHPFAVYLMAEEAEPSVSALAAEVGADDYFVEPLLIGRAALIERLQASGRFILYVGSGQEDARLMGKAIVSAVVPAAAERGESEFTESSAEIVLVEKNLARLVPLFEMAAQFAAKQSFNLAWPLLMDILDIGTTVFVHFGLVYSLMFSYSGTLVSAINARLPLVRYRRRQEAELRSKLLTLRK